MRRALKVVSGSSLRAWVTIACAMLTTACYASDAVTDGSCSGTHWVNVWQAPPTDAIAPVDASLLPFLAGPLQTVRAMLSPTGSGPVIRVHLSNRFGITPLTIGEATVALRTTGASIDPASLKALRFNGQRSVTIPAGKDVTSDSLEFALVEYRDLAVSVYAVDSGVTSTHHHVARQTSYATLPLLGNRTEAKGALAFPLRTTLRPFVTGVDVLVPRRESALLALGDSLTDGYQGVVGGMPQDLDEVDRNNRYPDFLRRRLSAAGRAIYVSNAGISGNQVLRDPQLPDGLPTYGPALLKRLDRDALQTAGVTDVLFMEGINDIGQRPSTSFEALTGGYREVIARLHARGLHVIQATLTPSGGYRRANYATDAAETLRQSINRWIRTQSPADAVVDFDAAVRDPANPARIDARYDGGDGLHFNAAGYQRLAETVDLNRIIGSGCD